MVQHQTIEQLQDCYPSRVSHKPYLIRRLEPSVHSPRGCAGPLTSAQLNDFEREGFLYVPRLLSPLQIEASMAELHRLVSMAKVRRSPQAVLGPRGYAVHRLYAVHELSELYSNLAASPVIVEMARQVLGSEVYLHQSRISLRPGLDGTGFEPWHSDFETWHVEDGMPAMRAVSCFISLTDSTEYSGPLCLIPGSHLWYVACVSSPPGSSSHGPLESHGYGTPPDPESLGKLARAGGLRSAKGPAGSAVLIDGNTMHGSLGNISPYPSATISVVYNSIKNRLVAPFSGREPRPQHMASRDFSPIG